MFSIRSQLVSTTIPKHRDCLNVYTTPLKQFVLRIAHAQIITNHDEIHQPTTGTYTSATCNLTRKSVHESPFYLT